MHDFKRRLELVDHLLEVVGHRFRDRLRRLVVSARDLKPVEASVNLVEQRLDTRDNFNLARRNKVAPARVAQGNEVSALLGEHPLDERCHVRRAAFPPSPRQSGT